MLVKSIRFMALGIAALGVAQEKSGFDKLPLWPANGNLEERAHGRYVFRDAATEEMVIVLPPDRSNPSAPHEIVRYRPQNQVDPKIAVRVSRASDGRFLYRYTIVNGASARQSIDAWTLVVSSVAGPMEPDHPQWVKIFLSKTALADVSHAAVPARSSAYWRARDPENRLDGAIGPGRRNEGFSVTSDSLPGLATAYVQGGPSFGTPGHLPVEVGEQLVPLMHECSSRVVISIGPRFGPQTDREAIAADYQEGLRELARQRKLDRNSPFYLEATSLLRKCHASVPCLQPEQASKLADAGSSELEKAIASALLVALGPR